MYFGPTAGLDQVTKQGPGEALEGVMAPEPPCWLPGNRVGCGLLPACIFRVSVGLYRHEFEALSAQFCL